MAAAGPGPIAVQVNGLVEGWEAFSTVDGSKFANSMPMVYYFCRSTGQVQWEFPAKEDAIYYYGDTINGRKPFEKGDELVPDPPPLKEYTGPLTDQNYCASCEDPEDVFQPDEDMLEACLNCDLQKLQSALADGADVSLPNWPWQNTPLHLAVSQPWWEDQVMAKEKQLRLELVQYLVRQGADLEAENLFHWKAIDLAVAHGYDAIYGYFQQQDAQLGWFGAAYTGNLDRIKELLETENIDIDLKGRYGRTAFAEAHLRGHWRVESWLVAQGCSRELPHGEFMKYNLGGAAMPIGLTMQGRQIQYFREDDPEWYDDMMEKRFPGYRARISHVPAARQQAT